MRNDLEEGSERKTREGGGGGAEGVRTVGKVMKHAAQVSCL